jgi:hypothetical protein
LIGTSDLGAATQDREIIGRERRWAGTSSRWIGQFDTVTGTEGKFGLATNYKEPFGTNRENGVKFRYRYIR